MTEEDDRDPQGPPAAHEGAHADGSENETDTDDNDDENDHENDDENDDENEHADGSESEHADGNEHADESEDENDHEDDHEDESEHADGNDNERADDDEGEGAREATARPFESSRSESMESTASPLPELSAPVRAPLAPGRLLIASLVGALALALVVALQHVRHGWPFYLHHGIGSERHAPAAAAVTHTTAPRTHVELEQARWGRLGVRVEAVRRETVGGTLRAVATIVPDESRVEHVHARVSGWVDRLYVRTTGEAVRVGQPLCAIFSQELLASQSEYLAARAAAGGRGPIVEGARERLRVLGVTDAQVAALERRGRAERLVTVVSRQGGVVLHRGITQGTAIDPSTELFTIADLGQVWALTEIPEVDAARVHTGASASVDVPASGLPPFEAEVSFVYPTLSERTRTLRARFALENTQSRLLPGMYGTATFRTEAREALVVTRDALVDTGIEQHVFVLEGERTFVPRQVRVGATRDDRVEILEGLAEGERVAASGVFLLDSESRLRASGQGAMGHAHGAGGGTTDHEAHERQGSPATTPSPVRRRASEPTPSEPTLDGEPALPPSPARSSPHAGHEGHVP
ncbi:MAG: efflux RND transporter periplasmic adaptor subunit [Sandaracinaceae bacterium]|nr:efflux RND transporter periplasmic adaptor subunit [Sandaracinaceae bacterium]